AVDEQYPHVTEGHFAREAFDTDTPVTQRTAVAIAVCDLRPACGDSFQTGFEADTRLLYAVRNPVVRHGITLRSKPEPDNRGQGCFPSRSRERFSRVR